MPAVSEGLIRIDHFILGSHLIAFVCHHYYIVYHACSFTLPNAFGPATLGFRSVTLNPLCTSESQELLLKSTDT